MSTASPWTFDLLISRPRSRHSPTQPFTCWLSYLDISVEVFKQSGHKSQDKRTRTLPIVRISRVQLEVCQQRREPFACPRVSSVCSFLHQKDQIKPRVLRNLGVETYGCARKPISELLMSDSSKFDVVFDSRRLLPPTNYIPSPALHCR